MYIKLVLKSNIKPIKPNAFIAPLALKLQIIKNNCFKKNPKFKSSEKLEKIKNKEYPEKKCEGRDFFFFSIYIGFELVDDLQSERVYCTIIH